MPSPFPGMDPYLEAPALWRGVHHRLITYIADLLSARLPERYVANINERLVVVESSRDIYPDSLVKEKPEARSLAHGNGGVAAVATQGDPAIRVSLEPETLPEAFVEIRLADSEDRVITVIEVLSPTNKMPGAGARGQYLAKQQELLRSTIHLLEIDLLRAGTYTVAAPRNHVLRQAEWNYIVSLHRAGEPECDAWPVTLRQRLPRVRVPLMEGDADFVLDLQEMINHWYDAGNYARHIDYRRDPVMPLSSTDVDWVSAVLRDRGLRNA